MNKVLIGLTIFGASFLFYLLTGNADMAFFGMLLMYYFEYRLLNAGN